MWHNRRFLSNSKQLCTNFGTSKFVVSCLFAVFAVQIVSCQDACSSGPCYPSPTDIAGNFNVTANSTCGDPPETFCVNLNCSNVCNANSDGLKHPPSFVNDDINANTFWKSKNYEYPVVLQLDIGRTFMLYQSTVTFYHELPAAMYFLKSNDSGLTYRPITYFATNCTKYFNLPETLKMTEMVSKSSVSRSTRPKTLGVSSTTDRSLIQMQRKIFCQILINRPSF